MTATADRPARALDLPPFFCPIPSAGHPDAERIDGDSLAWVAGLDAVGPGGLGRLARGRRGLAAAWAHPQGIPERVRVPADLMYLADALRDGTPPPGARRLHAALGRLAAAAEPPGAPDALDDPWLRGVRDVRRRLVQWATPLQAARWGGAWRRLLMGWSWEAAVLAEGAVPGLDEYVALRAYGSAGAESLTVLIDAVDGYEVPARQLEALPVRALTEMNWLVTALDEDLCRYEHGRRDRLNVVDVVARAEGCSADQAVPSVVSMRDRVMCLFLRLGTQVSAYASYELRRYVDGLGRQVRAGIDRGTGRRSGPFAPDGPPGIRVRPGPVCTDVPRDDRHEPVGVPAVAWWWDQLL
ncbi:hypothetical protein ABT160_06030 [Streptomyces sp. NPDC001941]|uniref:terpene synthase family protein n=1 Tax=Streptomyces sp. NPDC001941 TaxID=3154659 RepID=UPI003319361F